MFQINKPERIPVDIQIEPEDLIELIKKTILEQDSSIDVVNIDLALVEPVTVEAYVGEAPAKPKAKPRKKAAPKKEVTPEVAEEPSVIEPEDTIPFEMDTPEPSFEENQLNLIDELLEEEEQAKEPVEKDTIADIFNLT
ncbi:hypothetical protein [Vibrio phage vB_VhaP_PG11]|nr:hypothetical protein [Vibrio phage vB_VhaP_PG11]